ncbi:AraC family transcriptional regulator [Paenibacillus sp. GD4]|uniref:AraC family transcriptional regulator n=1 Tax=Paenibacillus sp. GD4 TaxID=3068890 RepID=UPI00279666CF|nr:AraC family transcriptional regulator [Paenibacillus sp. GD4]MDQ1914055.1 AraC family transcriptional regulator [Paenibacillus sp. GD4]
MEQEDDVLLCGYSYHKDRYYQGSREEQLTSYLIRLQTEGTCVAIVDGNPYRIGAGDLLLVRPGTPYELRVEETDPVNPEKEAKISSGDYFLFCRGKWMDEWWFRTSRPLLVRIEGDETLLSIWEQLITEKCRYRDYNAEIISYLLRLLCLHLDRSLSDTSSKYSSPYTASRMKRYIERHAYETFKVEDVAKYVGLSVSRTAHFFKECYGKSMIQYALEIRLGGAVERMKYTSMSLEQISDSCGFRSYTFFHRAFKEKYGMTPALYRSQLTSLTSSSPR